MDTDREGIAGLERRLRAVEDQLAVLRLLAAYGPAVDSGASAAAAALWTEDGGYDVGGVARVAGQEELTALYDGPQHRGIIAGGSAHLTVAPVISVDGDSATATGYSVVCRRDGEGFAVWRVAANRWTLARTADGWRVVERVNRVLDGSPEPRELLGGAR